MAGRIRTTKKLAQRITLDYFKTLHGIPRWRRILSGVLVVAGLLWLTWYAVAGSPKPYNAGPLAHSHALLGQNCAACHVAQAGYQKSATDQACLACHDGPTHHAEQTFTPACSNCHVEHQGIMRLASTSDRACTQCHDHLTTKEGKVKYVANITGFSSGSHPDFAVWRNGGMDPATIKLNHKVHLKPDLRGPNGTVQMKCADCHEAPAAVPIIAAPVTSLSPVPDPPSPNIPDTSRPAPPVLFGSKAGALTLTDKSYMAPINFDKHCASCHPLQFDRRISEPAPHDKQPQEVYDFMVAKLTAYIAAHPAEIPLVDEPDKRLPSRPPQPPARNAAEWVQQRMEDAQLLMWRKACLECHTMNYPNGADALPVAAPSNVTTRWLPHSEFDHTAHQMVKCESCHEKATDSHETADLLIPRIETCEKCHKTGQDSAEVRCFECHAYHDWNKEKPPVGKYTIKQLTAGI